MSDCCGCTTLDNEEEYDMGLHVGAIFIIFAVSALGTALPLIAQKFQVSTDALPMEMLMSFSYGVVIATGLIHMVNEGVEMLSNPCLGSVVEEYESLGQAFVLVTLVVMHLIECESAVFFADNGAPLLHGHGHAHGHIAVPTSVQSETAVTVISSETNNSFHHSSSDKEVAVATVTASRKTRKQIATLMFEMGVIFHSVIIGVDLSVTTGSEFKTLLAALSFHQFFEGVAVGGSALQAIESHRKLFLMNFAFAITTPLGQVIGMAIRSSYSDSSVTALWVQGILNCVAGGILIYAGLVELLTYNMTMNNTFLARVSGQRFLLYLSVWLGAGLMAWIGKWA